MAFLRRRRRLPIPTTRRRPRRLRRLFTLGALAAGVAAYRNRRLGGPRP